MSTSETRTAAAAFYATCSYLRLPHIQAAPITALTPGTIVFTIYTDDNETGVVSGPITSIQDGLYNATFTDDKDEEFESSALPASVLSLPPAPEDALPDELVLAKRVNFPPSLCSDPFFGPTKATDTRPATPAPEVPPPAPPAAPSPISSPPKLTATPLPRRPSKRNHTPAPQKPAAITVPPADSALPSPAASPKTAPTSRARAPDRTRVQRNTLHADVIGDFGTNPTHVIRRPEAMPTHDELIHLLSLWRDYVPTLADFADPDMMRAYRRIALLAALLGSHDDEHSYDQESIELEHDGTAFPIFMADFIHCVHACPPPAAAARRGLNRMTLRQACRPAAQAVYILLKSAGMEPKFHTQLYLKYPDLFHKRPWCAVDYYPEGAVWMTSADRLCVSRARPTIIEGSRRTTALVPDNGELVEASTLERHTDLDV